MAETIKHPIKNWVGSYSSYLTIRDGNGIDDWTRYTVTIKDANGVNGETKIEYFGKNRITPYYPGEVMAVQSIVNTIPKDATLGSRYLVGPESAFENGYKYKEISSVPAGSTATRMKEVPLYPNSTSPEYISVDVSDTTGTDSGETQVGTVTKYYQLIQTQVLRYYSDENYTASNDWYIAMIQGEYNESGGYVKLVEPELQKLGTLSVRVVDRGLKSYVLVDGKLRTYDDVDCGTF